MPSIGQLSHQEIEDSGAVELSKMSTQIPLLGASDRSVVYLVYERLLRLKTLHWHDNVWPGCFDCTVWEVFESADINDHTTHVTDYIHFCVDSVVPTKKIKWCEWQPLGVKQVQRPYKTKMLSGATLIQPEGTFKDIKRLIMADKYKYS